MEWVNNNHNVVASIISRNITLVSQSGSTNKVNVPKILMEYYVRQLHNEFIDTNDNGCFSISWDTVAGDVLVSDTSLHKVLLQEIWIMKSYHKIMCEYLHYSILQNYLN